MDYLKIILYTLILMIVPKSYYKQKDYHKIHKFYNGDIKKLAILVQKEDTAGMQKFIQSHPLCDIDEPDSQYGRSLLMWSIFYGHYNSVNELLKFNVNVNFISPKDGYTPLMYAVEYDKRFNYSEPKYLNILLTKGANPNIITFNTKRGFNQNALNKASMRSLDYTKILIEKGGANPYLLVDSVSILETAILFGRMDVASYLVDSCEMSLSAPSGFYKNGKRIYDVLKIADCSKGDSLNIQLKQKLLRQAEEKKHLADEL